MTSNINFEYMLKQDKLYEVQFDAALYNQVEEAELDEMWSYVQNKSNQRWLCLAIDHHSRAVLAYTFGKREDEVFRSFQKILAPFGITMFYTDDWGSYERNIEAENHKTGQSNTHELNAKI